MTENRWLLGGLALLALAGPARGQSRDAWESLRARMVEEDIRGAGIENERVLDAISATPRHEFVLPADKRKAYFDMALAIGEGQTISPPFVVAYMTEQLDPQPEDRVLEIGTGSGYQAAVLSPLVRDVYSIEIVEPLGRRAAKTLQRLGYENVHTRIGDGFLGWSEAAPFDKIIVTCSPEDVPDPLVEQLREGGRMVIPLGERYQQTLYLLRKENGQLVTEALRHTLFVPMTGAAEDLRDVQPDPLHPTLVNSGFEELDADSGELRGWHYVRQMDVEEGENVPAGARYALFRNADASRGSQALQAFAVDGRRVRMLELSCRVRASNIRPGRNPGETAAIVISFFDERRAVVAEQGLGPWRGTFDWQVKASRIRVPEEAREAIIRIGLLGATGELGLDDVAIEAVDVP